MNNKTLRQLISIGDLIERKLINNMKVERSLDQNEDLHNQNLAIDEAIDELSTHPVDSVKLMRIKTDLLKTLEMQWKLLDIVFDPDSKKDQADAAIKAQLLNSDRVTIKNQINELFGSWKEIKTYS